MTENCKEKQQKWQKPCTEYLQATHPFLFSLSFDTEIEGKKVLSGLENKQFKPSVNIGCEASLPSLVGKRR